MQANIKDQMILSVESLRRKLVDKNYLVLSP